MQENQLPNQDSVGQVPQQPTTYPQQVPQSLKPKKRKGLIIGIITGSIVLTLLIIALLAYFLWWSNPQKMVTDAMINSFQATRVTMNGKITMANDGNKMDMTIKGRSDSPQGYADVAFSFTPKDGTVPLTGSIEAMTASDGTLYFKAKELRKMVDSFIDQLIVQSMASELTAEQQAMLDSSEGKQYMDGMKRAMIEQFDPLLTKIDGEWIKISPKDIHDMTKSEATCSLDILKKIQTDTSVQREMLDAYKKHSFVVVKDAKVGDRNGGRGFEIAVGSQQMQDRARDFMRTLEQTSIGREIKGCAKDSNVSSDDSELPKTDGSGSLKLWVSPLSHELTAVELVVKSNDTDILMSIDMTMGKAEAITEPNNATRLNDIVEDMTGGSGLGGLLPSRT